MRFGKDILIHEADQQECLLHHFCIQLYGIIAGQALALLFYGQWLIHLLFPKPGKKENWFTYVVFGKKLWLENFMKKPKLDLSLVLNIITATSFIPSIYFAYINMFWPTLYLSTLMYISKLWYADKIALQYKNYLILRPRSIYICFLAMTFMHSSTFPF